MTAFIFPFAKTLKMQCKFEKNLVVITLFQKNCLRKLIIMTFVKIVHLRIDWKEKLKN